MALRHKLVTITQLGVIKDDSFIFFDENAELKKLLEDGWFIHELKTDVLPGSNISAIVITVFSN